MRLRGQGGGTHLGQQIGHGGIGAQVDVQGLGVDEQADQRLQFATRALGDGSADDHLVLAGQTRQQRAPGGEQGHEEGGALALAQGDQRLGVWGIEGHRDGVAGVVLFGRTRSVGRQGQ